MKKYNVLIAVLVVLVLVLGGLIFYFNDDLFKSEGGLSSVLEDPIAEEVVVEEPVVEEESVVEEEPVVEDPAPEEEVLVEEPVADPEPTPEPEPVPESAPTPPPAQVGLSDADGDGTADTVDNCPSTANSQQKDMDNDGVGNECDPDNDNDGVPNEQDQCIWTFNRVVGPDGCL